MPMITSLRLILSMILAGLISRIPGLQESFFAREILPQTARYALRLGYFLLPIFLFSNLCISVTLLRREKKALKFFGRIISFSLLVSLILSLTGAVAGLFISGKYIPRLKGDPASLFSLQNFLENLIPSDILSFFFRPEGLIPLFLFGVIFAASFHKDREVSAPVFNLLDSLSRLFYRLNLILVRWSFLPLFFIFLNLIFQTETGLNSGREYRSVLTGLTITLFVLLFLLLPLLVRLKIKRRKLRYVFSLFPALIGSLITGNHYYTYSLLVPVAKENLNIPRREGGSMIAFLSVFFRGGTVFFISLFFVVIIKGYSSLGLSLFQVIWGIFFSFLIGLIVPSFPFGNGFYSGTALLFFLYGRTLENGYMTLIPLLPLLTALSVFLDTVAALVIITLLCPRDKAEEAGETIKL